MDLITNHTHTLHTHTHLLPIRHVLYVGVVMPTVHTVTHVNNDCKQFAKFHHWVELDRHLGHLRRAKMKQIAGLEFMVFICVCDVCCVLCAVCCVLCAHHVLCQVQNGGELDVPLYFGAFHPQPTPLSPARPGTRGRRCSVVLEPLQMHSQDRGEVLCRAKKVGRG